MNNKHIILIGFKAVGKSTVARALSQQLKLNLIDLDQEIEQVNKGQSCREIVEQKGEAYFREAETRMLELVLKNAPSVIALGGGAILNLKNRDLIRNHIVVHITAGKSVVFERILATGWPAYYNPRMPMRAVFNELWELREKLYQELALITVENENDAEKTAGEIAKQLNAPQRKNILVLHGPNLNCLGLRDAAHYGSGTLSDLENYLRDLAIKMGYQLSCHQANHEGSLIDILQQKVAFHSGVIINPGALSHYSYALHDALLDTKLPIVEVHLSNLEEREKWRQHSVTAAACIAKIHGKKWEGYREALELLVEHLHHEKK